LVSGYEGYVYGKLIAGFLVPVSCPPIIRLLIGILRANGCFHRTVLNVRQWVLPPHSIECGAQHRKPIVSCNWHRIPIYPLRIGAHDTKIPALSFPYTYIALIAVKTGIIKQNKSFKKLHVGITGPI
jgi:hypothetical protein